MRKSRITFKPATMAHAREFYGDQYTKSFKGYAALLDGKVVGIAGISFEDETMVLFSDMKKEMRPFKRDIVRAIWVLGDMVENARYPIVAVVDKKEPAAEKILTKLGFTHSGHLNPDGSKMFRRFP
jgi:hypothetical protein